MPSSLDQGSATKLLTAITIPGNYTAFTAPVQVALCTAQGSATANGTEVANSGGSTYARQNLGAATASAGSVSNSAAINFTNMPAITGSGVVAVELWDSAGTKVRISQGSLTAAKTTNLGDTLSFATGSLVQTLA